MKPDHLAVICECASDADFKTGDVLFREGEPANRLYLIERGRVAIEATCRGEGPKVVQEVAGGDVLGWSWLFPPFVWHFGARSLEPTHALVLDGGHLLAAAERDHDFGYELMKRVVQVGIQRLQSTRRQMVRAEPVSAKSG
ncbi:MAG TPA: cyclic nucleotide-binding domain-containing protein [Methylomirabilota bacterium]|nr:cyclic nucleotide-binding domain-containing protein [Methylomirabilota bacterium]